MADAVKVRRVLLKTVKRREVHAAAKPGHYAGVGRRGRQHAHVHVNRGHIGVVRMHDERHAQCLESSTGQFRAI